MQWNYQQTEKKSVYQFVFIFYSRYIEFVKAFCVLTLQRKSDFILNSIYKLLEKCTSHIIVFSCIVPSIEKLFKSSFNFFFCFQSKYFLSKN